MIASAVVSPGSAITADEHLVRGLQKHNLTADLMLAQTADNIEKLVEEPLASKVARYGKVPANARVNAHHLGDLHNEARR